MKIIALCFLLFCFCFNLTAQVKVKKSRPYKVWVKMKDQNQKAQKGYLTSLKDSSVVLFDIAKTTHIEVMISELDQLKFRKDGKIGRSIAIGAGAGIVAGAIIGYADGDDGPEIFFSMTAEQKAMSGSMTGASIGIVTGAIIGIQRKKYNIMGNQDNYLKWKDELSKYIQQ